MTVTITALGLLLAYCWFTAILMLTLGFFSLVAPTYFPDKLWSKVTHLLLGGALLVLLLFVTCGR